MSLLNNIDFLDDLNGKVLNFQILEDPRFGIDFTSKDTFLSSVLVTPALSHSVKRILSKAINITDTRAVIVDENYPVLRVEKNKVVLSKLKRNFADKFLFWSSYINPSIPYVGRIEWDDRPPFNNSNDYPGTGFLIKNTSFIVTCRHVAELFIEPRPPLSFKIFNKRYHNIYERSFNCKISIEKILSNS